MPTETTVDFPEKEKKASDTPQTIKGTNKTTRKIFATQVREALRIISNMIIYYPQNH
ncbi:hypothetical protein DJ66_0369 [Candidatus Liberibacter solanacearum]|uniref:Uncharacterized protein n=1 Tax=Candidatus Liberibacter solanacearum TaxID=556287 RepID=A0A0F4VLT5_9HYPH|nr:hypothetical protein DJ66_0369 [Candidatus Liberibacter solanacearum]